MGLIIIDAPEATQKKNKNILKIKIPFLLKINSKFSAVTTKSIHFDF